MTTLVILPHVGRLTDPLHRAIVASSGGQPHGWRVQSVELVASDPTAYWHCLKTYWELALMGGIDLMVIEHDILVKPFVFDQLTECPNNWCSFPYWLGASYDYALGCVRFRHALIEKYPEAAEKAGQPTEGGDGLPEFHWKRLDTRLYSWLQHPVRGETFCRHWPPVKHMHEYAMPEPDDPDNAQAAIAEFRQKVAGQWIGDHGPERFAPPPGTEVIW